MPDFPTLRNIDRIVISAACEQSIGEALRAMSFTPATAAPTANLAYFTPFTVYSTITVTKMFVENGSTTSGNLDVGIYDAGGTKLVSSGTVAQTGASSTQEIDITDTTLRPGLYYLAFAADNGTGSYMRWGTSNTVNPRTFGVLSQASACPLPATATFATPINNLPFVAVTQRTLV